MSDPGILLGILNALGAGLVAGVAVMGTRRRSRQRLDERADAYRRAHRAS